MNSTNFTNIILDSSVVAKWFFPSEENIEIALKIKDLFLTKEISISVPVLIYYEVNNLIRTAIKSLRINEELAKEAHQGFLINQCQSKNKRCEASSNERWTCSFLKTL